MTKNKNNDVYTLANMKNLINTGRFFRHNTHQNQPDSNHMPRTGLKRSLFRFFLYCGLLSCVGYVVVTWTSLVKTQVTPRPSIVPNNRNGTAKAMKPVILLKLPRTGSTWLTDILNSFKEIYLTKEIIQHEDVRKYSDSEKVNHLVKALRFPADRISKSGSLMPSMRYIEEFVKTWKFSVRMRLLGFTVNPENIGEEVLNGVIRRVPGTEVIVLKRRNLVKLAASAATGRNVYARTGMSNLRSSELKVHEADYRLNWNLSSLINEYYTTKSRYKSFLDKINNLNVTVHSIYYEDLQLDLEGALDDLFASLGYKNLAWPHRIEHASAALFNASDSTGINLVAKEKAIPKIEKDKSKWKKRTPESLQNVLTNYHYLHETIDKKSRKHGLMEKYVGYPVSKFELKCILEQLESTEPVRAFVNCPDL